MPRLFDVSLAQNKEQIKTVDGKLNMVILKTSVKKKKSSYISVIGLGIFNNMRPSHFPNEGIVMLVRRKELYM